MDDTGKCPECGAPVNVIHVNRIGDPTHHRYHRCTACDWADAPSNLFGADETQTEPAPTSTTPKKPKTRGEKNMAVSKRLRFEVLRRDGMECHYCHRKDVPLTVDHVIPQALGGPSTAENLVACCRDCNIGKTSINPDEPLVAGVSEQAEAFREALAEAKAVVASDFLWEQEYMDRVRDLWEDATSLDDEYCLPMPVTWRSTARYWGQIGVPRAFLEYAFGIAKERYDSHRLTAKKAFAYASGIVGNRMEEAARLAREKVK
ncbi:HNH endonuclease [Bifidobacterium castoris]|uniref:HNH endonuclease n=1 Tax=Bifidobacterium castoris TaxID=2306972 RepID=A0A430F4Y2_9BIFI|nr:HNH endonuclease [Bifidobacterium castoris]RSX44676.1 HNH endonuclease [Bifidobacterium castoris]